MPAPGACDNLGVRLNTHPVSACKEPEYDSISTAHRDRPRHDWEYDFIEIARFFDLLFDGDNVFEFIPPQVDDRLEWAEVLVLPTNRCKQEACLPNGDSDCRNPRQAVFCALGALLRQQRHRAVSLCQAEVKTHVAVVSEVLEGPQESLRRHQRNRWSRAIAVRMHCPAGKRLNKLIT